MSLSIEVEGLRLRYGKVLALGDVTFSLAGGRIYGLLGRNGAGKTSLVSVLAGFRKASSGRVLVGGEPVFENAPIVRQICCLTPGPGDVIQNDSVKDALDFDAYLRPNWDADYAAALVERFELPLRARVSSLSRGQVSALHVSRGLATRAPVTIFDEPHLGMDAPSRYAFYDELLTDFMAHPRTIIISTHLIDEVSSLFEEVLILDRGRLLLHEEADVLRARGMAVTGPAEAVDRFIDGLSVLGEKRLGPTKSATIYATIDDDRRADARQAGLELGPVTLQDLFVQLTERSEEPV